MKLLFATLFSGSSGNAVYISCGDEAILIDAGKNCRALERAAAALGENLQKVRAVFVTHEHSDHISALPVFCRRYGVPVYVPLACAEAVGELPPTAVPYEGLCDQTVGNFHVTGFRTPHDSAGSVGTVEAGGVTVKGTQVRAALGLRSACFEWEAQGEKLVFYVTGYGHGVGLSQYGANRMAAGGADYKEILTHYYTGVTVEPYLPG